MFTISRLVCGTPEVHGLPVVIVSSIAMIVMLIVAMVLRVDLDDDGDDADVHEQLSSRAVLLETLADAAAAAGVAVAGGIILATHSLYWLDPSVALVIAAVIGFHAIQLLHEVRLALRR